MFSQAVVALACARKQNPVAGMPLGVAAKCMMPCDDWLVGIRCRKHRLAMTRSPWTREQLLQTLSLYCQIPFGKMHARNPAVIALANSIQRTSAAVAFKLVNFASLDPDVQERGVGGMKNTSQADRAIWDEYFGKWEALAASNVVSLPAVEHPRLRRPATEPTAPTGPTEVTREVAQRRGQNFFRSAVLAAHDFKCCITGIQSEPLLRASHIVPWSQEASLRLNPRNGLCLNALHDAAFDRGLITISSRFELVLSKRLKVEVPGTVYKEMFDSRAGLPIAMPSRFLPAAEMLDFHRANIFCR